MAVLAKVLLGIVLLILLVLLYLLFAPIRYRGDLEVEDEERFFAKVYDPLRFLKITFLQQGEKMEFSLRIMYGLYRIKDDKEGKKEQERGLKAGKKKNKDHSRHKEEKKTSGRRGIGGCIADGTLREALPTILVYIGKLLRVIKPKKLEAKIVFSLGEADLTGYATGVISMIPVTYHKKVHLTPDFLSDTGYVRGYAGIRGRCSLIRFLILGISFFFHKEIRDLLVNFRE